MLAAIVLEEEPSAGFEAGLEIFGRTFHWSEEAMGIVGSSVGLVSGDYFLVICLAAIAAIWTRVSALLIFRL